MTAYLYHLEYDVVIQAPTKEEADEIVNNLNPGMEAYVWSSMVEYRGIDEGD